MSDTSPPLPAYSDEKKVVDSREPDVERAAPSGRARWFGGPNFAVGPRIAPVLSSTLSATYTTDSDDSSGAILHKQKEAEANATIKYRTCSWQKVCAVSLRVFPVSVEATMGLRKPGRRFVGIMLTYMA